MGLLKLVDDVPNVDFYEYRDIEYYSKYQYRARLTIKGIRYTWFVKTPQEFLKKLENNTDRGGLGYASVRKNEKEEVLKNKDIIAKFIELRNKVRGEKIGTVRIEGSTAAIFSNDLDLLTEFRNTFNDVDITQVKISEFVGVKQFVKEPKHKFRIYLRSKRTSEEFTDSLRDTINRNGGLYPSTGLKKWLNKPTRFRFNWSSASHYIDYDDESTLSYIMLLHGDMMGKRYRLEKRPDTE
jgi:hypothetical protein